MLFSKALCIIFCSLFYVICALKRGRLMILKKFVAIIIKSHAYDKFKHTKDTNRISCTNTRKKNQNSQLFQYKHLVLRWCLLTRNFNIHLFKPTSLENCTKRFKNRSLWAALIDEDLMSWYQELLKTHQAHHAHQAYSQQQTNNSTAYRIKGVKNNSERRGWSQNSKCCCGHETWLYL